MKDRIEVAKVLIENDDGEFLVVQKSGSYDWKADKWELPGGKIEKDEDRFQAAKRELDGETGLKAADLQEVIRVEVEESGDEKPVVDCWILHTTSFSGEIEISDEHQDYRWVSGEEFLDMDWHRDAGYALPAMINLENYLER